VHPFFFRPFIFFSSSFLLLEMTRTYRDVPLSYLPAVPFLPCRLCADLHFLHSFPPYCCHDDHGFRWSLSIKTSLSADWTFFFTFQRVGYLLLFPWSLFPSPLFSKRKQVMSDRSFAAHDTWVFHLYLFSLLFSIHPAETSGSRSRFPPESFPCTRKSLSFYAPPLSFCFCILSHLLLRVSSRFFSPPILPKVYSQIPLSANFLLLAFVSCTDLFCRTLLVGLLSSAVPAQNF